MLSFFLYKKIELSGFWGFWARQRRTSVRAQHSGPKIKGETRMGGRMGGRMAEAGGGWGMSLAGGCLADEGVGRFFSSPNTVEENFGYLGGIKHVKRH